MGPKVTHGFCDPGLSVRVEFPNQTHGALRDVEAKVNGTDLLPARGKLITQTKRHHLIAARGSRIESFT